VLQSVDKVSRHRGKIIRQPERRCPGVRVGVKELRVLVAVEQPGSQAGAEQVQVGIGADGTWRYFLASE